MNFAQAWSLMKQGKKVKREHRGGFWSLENGEIIIYSKDGEITNIRDTGNVVGTFNNIAASDWILCEGPKKVFISQSMDGNDTTSILGVTTIAVNRVAAIDKAKEMLGKDIVVVWSRLAKDNERLFAHLSEDISAMIGVDVVFFARGWENDIRCVIEHECAEKCGIQIVEELS